MLSQFKFYLQQAISCIILHADQIKQICSTSIQPLNDKLTQILPTKLYTIFAGVMTSNNYSNIQQFFIHIEQMQKDKVDLTTNNSNNFNKLNNNSQDGSPIQLKHGFIRRRKTSVRKHPSQIQGISFSESYAAILKPQSNQQLINLIFSEYKKVDEGGKRHRSFTQKQQFKNTLNYHKIIRFLEEIKAKLTPDLRLKLLILIKKKTQQPDFVKKQQFSELFKDIKTLFQISSQMQQEFLQKRNLQIESKKRLFSRQLYSRSQRKVIKNPTSFNLSKLSSKNNPQKLDISKLTNQIVSPLQQNNDKKQLRQFSPPVLQKQKQGNVIKSRLYQSRKSQGAINWQNISKNKVQNNTKHVQIPQIILNPLCNEDDYYLNEFHKSTNIS